MWDTVLVSLIEVDGQDNFSFSWGDEVNLLQHDSSWSECALFLSRSPTLSVKKWSTRSHHTSSCLQRSIAVLSAGCFFLLICFPGAENPHLVFTACSKVFLRLKSSPLCLVSMPKKFLSRSFDGADAHPQRFLVDAVDPSSNVCRRDKSWIFVCEKRPVLLRLQICWTPPLAHTCSV